MKDFAYYSKVPVEYPDRYAIKGKHLALVAEMRLTERERKAANDAAIADANEEYGKALTFYRVAEKKLEQEFWADCRSDFGYDKLMGLSGQSALEGYAWERGHSSGYSEVYNCLCDLVPLVECCLKDKK